MIHQALVGTEMNAVSMKEYNSFDNRQHKLEVLGIPPMCGMQLKVKLEERDSFGQWLPQEWA